jgi:hypothetical protein
MREVLLVFSLLCWYSGGVASLPRERIEVTKQNLNQAQPLHLSNNDDASTDDEYYYYYYYGDDGNTQVRPTRHTSLLFIDLVARTMMQLPHQMSRR